MKKMIARTALVVTLVVSALGLTACGSNGDDCAHAASANTVTATTAMFPARAGGGGHSSGHTSEGHVSESSHSGIFTWPHFFAGSHSDQCPNPAPTSKS